MIPERICVIVQTSTKLKFVASIPTTSTIRDMLPLLLNKYLAVVRENMRADEYDIDYYVADSIKQITKNGCLIPLGEYVSDVIVNNDSLFINLNQESVQRIQSKKEKLQKKKEEKEIIKHKNKDQKEINERQVTDSKKQNILKQYSKIQQQAEHRHEPTKEVKLSQIKTQLDSLKKNEKPVIQRSKILDKESNEIVSNLLLQMRSKSDNTISKTVQKPKPKFQIVQEDSSS